MTVKAGKFITTGQGYLLSRLQNTGVNNVNIPKEKIYETGNEQSVATVRDIPQVGFELESFNMTVRQEKILTGRDPDVSHAGPILFTESIPQQFAAPFKGAGVSKDTVGGIAVPHGVLESVNYRFGVGQSAAQTFSFTSDSYYLAENGTPYYVQHPGGDVGGEYDFEEVALPTSEKGEDVYALGVTVVFADGSAKRLFHGDDFSNDPTGITLIDPDAAPAGSTVHLLYKSAVEQNWPQIIHPPATAIPAALRGQHIDVYVEAPGVGLVRWNGVQSVDVSWSVTLENTEELGNPHYVSSEYDVPEVTGSLVMRPASASYLFEKIAEVTNTPAGYVTNLLSSQPLEMEIRLRDPETNDVLKSLRVPDATFDPPPVNAQVQSNVEITFPMESEGGVLEVYEGDVY